MTAHDKYEHSITQAKMDWEERGTVLRQIASLRGIAERMLANVEHWLSNAYGFEVNVSLVDYCPDSPVELCLTTDGGFECLVCGRPTDGRRAIITDM